MSVADQKVVRSVHKLWAKSLKGRSLAEVQDVLKHSNDEAFLLLGGGLASIAKGLSLKPDRDPSGGPSSPGGGGGGSSSGGGLDTSLVHASTGSTRLKALLLKELRSAVSPAFHIEANEGTQFRPSIKRVRSALEFVTASVSCGVPRGAAGILTSVAEQTWMHDPGCAELALSCYRAVTASILSLPAPSSSSEASNGGSKIRSAYVEAHGEPSDTSSSIVLSPVAILARYIAQAALMFDTEHDGGDAFKSELLVSVSHLQVTDGKKKSGKSDPVKDASDALAAAAAATTPVTVVGTLEALRTLHLLACEAYDVASHSANADPTFEDTKNSVKPPIASAVASPGNRAEMFRAGKAIPSSFAAEKHHASPKAGAVATPAYATVTFAQAVSANHALRRTVDFAVPKLIAPLIHLSKVKPVELEGEPNTNSGTASIRDAAALVLADFTWLCCHRASAGATSVHETAARASVEKSYKEIFGTLALSLRSAADGAHAAVLRATHDAEEASLPKPTVASTSTATIPVQSHSNEIIQTGEDGGLSRQAYDEACKAMLDAIQPGDEHHCYDALYGFHEPASSSIGKANLRVMISAASRLQAAIIRTSSIAPFAPSIEDENHTNISNQSVSLSAKMDAPPTVAPATERKGERPPSPSLPKEKVIHKAPAWHSIFSSIRDLIAIPLAAGENKGSLVQMSGLILSFSSIQSEALRVLACSMPGLLPNLVALLRDIALDGKSRAFIEGTLHVLLTTTSGENAPRKLFDGEESKEESKMDSDSQTHQRVQLHADPSHPLCKPLLETNDFSFSSEFLDAVVGVDTPHLFFSRVIDPRVFFGSEIDGSARGAPPIIHSSRAISEPVLPTGLTRASGSNGPWLGTIDLSLLLSAGYRAPVASSPPASSSRPASRAGGSATETSTAVDGSLPPSPTAPSSVFDHACHTMPVSSTPGASAWPIWNIVLEGMTPTDLWAPVVVGSGSLGHDEEQVIEPPVAPPVAASTAPSKAAAGSTAKGGPASVAPSKAAPASVAAPAASVAGTKAAGGKAGTVAPTVVSSAPTGPAPIIISMSSIARTFPSHMIDGHDKTSFPDLITWESRLAGLRLTASVIETANQSQTASGVLLASKVPAMVARLAVDSASLVFKLPAVVSESTGGEKSSPLSGELTSVLMQSLLLSIQILDSLLHLSSKNDRASVCTSLGELGPLCIDTIVAVALHTEVLVALLPAMKDILKNGVSGGIDRTENFIIPVRLFDPRDSLDLATSGMLPHSLQECAELRSWAMKLLRSCAGADKDLRTYDKKSPAHPIPLRIVPHSSSSSATPEAAPAHADPKKGAALAPAPAPAPAKDAKGKPAPAAAAAIVAPTAISTASLSDVTDPPTASPVVGVDWDCSTESRGERLSLLVLRHVPLFIQAYSHSATCSGTLDLLSMRLNGMSSLYTPQSTDPKAITVSSERKIISGSVIRIGILSLLDEIALIYRGRDRLVSEILAIIRDFSAIVDLGDHADLSPALTSAKRILNCQRSENNVPFIYGRLGCLVLGSSSSFNAQLHALPLSLAAQAKLAADEAKAAEVATSSAPATAAAGAGGKGGKDVKKAEAPKKAVAMAVEAPPVSDSSALIASILAARRAWVHPVELSNNLPPPLLSQAEDIVVNGSIVSRTPFLPPVLHGIDLFCTNGSPFFFGGRGLEFENKSASFFTPSAYLWALPPGSTSHVAETLLLSSGGALLDEAKKVAIETAAKIEQGLVVDEMSFSMTSTDSESLSAHISQDIVKFALSAVAVSSIILPIASILRHMEPLPSELELLLALRVVQSFTSDMHRGISTQSVAAEAAIAESISAGCVVHSLALSEFPPLPNEAVTFSKNPTLACMIHGVNTSLTYPMYQWKGMLVFGPQGRNVLTKQANLLFKWLHSRPTARSSFWGRVKQSVTRPLSAAEAEYIANAGEHVVYPKGVVRLDKEASTITEEMLIGRDDPLFPSILDSISSSNHHDSAGKDHGESLPAGAIVIAPLSDSIINRRKGHAFEVFGSRLDESALNGRLCRITNLDPLLASLPYGISAIIAAIALDSSAGDEAVASLLANGVSPDNGREDDGVTPLMLSLLFGKVSLAKTILDFGANIHAKDYTGNNALKYSFLSTSKASRTSLCELESNRDARAVDLPRLSRYQDHSLDSVLDSLMSAPATVSTTDSSVHGTPGRASQSKVQTQPRVQPRVAPIAAKPRKKAQAVRNEIRKGEDSEKQAERDAASFNGLVSRSEEAAVRMLQRLVRRGMFRRRIAEARVFLSVEASDINAGSVPVFYTDWTIAFEAITLLISRGADATIGDATGNTAVHWLTVGTTLFEVVSRVRACRFAPVCSVSTVPKAHISDILSMLIANNANLDHQNLAGATPLHCACEIGHLWTASKLLSLGANAFYLDRLNCLPLHYAALGRGLPNAREAARLDGYSGTPYPYDNAVTSAVAAVRSNEEARAARGAAARAASTAQGFRASSVVASAGPNATALDNAVTIPPRTVFFLNLLEKTCGDKRSREESQNQVQSDVLHPTRPLDVLMCGNRFGITPFMVASGANLDGSMGLRSKSEDFTLAPTYTGFHPLLLAVSRFGKALRLGVVYVQGMSASDCSKEDAATALKFSIKIEQKSNKLADLLSDVQNLMPTTRFVYVPVAVLSNYALSIPSFMYSIVDEVTVRADLCYAVVGLSEMIALKADTLMVMRKAAVMSSEAIISLLTESTELFSTVKLKVGEVTRPTRSEAAGLTHSALLDVHNHARTLVSARSLAGRNCFHFSAASWHMPLRELYAIAVRPTKAAKLHLQQRQLMQPQVKLQTKDIEVGRNGEHKKNALNTHIKSALREYYTSALRILKTLTASAEGTLATPLLEQPSTLEMWNLLNVRNVKTLAFLPSDPYEGSAGGGKEGSHDDRFVIFNAASRPMPPPGVVLVQRDAPTQTLNDVTVPDQAGLTPLGFSMLHLRHKDAYNSLITGISASDVGLESYVPLQGEIGVLESAAWSLLPLGLASATMKSDSVAETVGVSDSLKSSLASVVGHNSVG
jgi:ankyrin repeat protein